ncbi:hypothetical protein BF49_3710 [Bradyrhizobium sp.]|nr:hypothetical protein BF49_3710 [Bradyrhizobium sp.]
MTGQASLPRHHFGAASLSGIVKAPSLESTTKTASKLAGSVSLAFSLTL